MTYEKIETNAQGVCSTTIQQELHKLLKTFNENGAELLWETVYDKNGDMLDDMDMFFHVSTFLPDVAERCENGICHFTYGEYTVQIGHPLFDSSALFELCKKYAK